MRIDYFSDEEDAKFSELIVSYNKMREEGNEDKKLMEFIKERVSLLLYMIPINYLFSDHDEAADIYIDLYKKIEYIVHTYRVTGVSFNRYLTQICRNKAYNQEKDWRKKDQIEKDVIYYDLCTMENYAYLDTYAKEDTMHYGIPRPEAELLDMSSLARFIINNRDIYEGEEPDLSDEELELYHLLEKGRNRKSLLIYLMNLPDSPTPDLISSISKAYSLDSLVFCHFFRLKADLLSKQTLKREDHYLKGIRHWKLMMSLSHAMNLEVDEEKIKGLQDKYDKLAICHEERMNKARAKRGLTQNEIADIFGECRANVGSNLMKARNMLKGIVEGVVAH